MTLSGIWESFLAHVEPHLPEYLHWNEICWTFVYYLAEVRLWIHRRTRGMEHWENISLITYFGLLAGILAINTEETVVVGGSILRKIVTTTALYCFYFFIGLEVFRWLFSFLFCRDESLKDRFVKTFFRIVRNLPIVKARVQAELAKTLDEMDRMAFPLQEGTIYIHRLPDKGLSREELSKAVEKMQNKGGGNWESGLVSGTVYHGGSELRDILTEVYSKFAWTNPLHPDIFPDVRKMEAEVVRMTATMFNGDSNCCGTMTTGGTESILLACKAYRDRGYENGITKPEIICATSAHAAFDKACNYFRIKLVHVPVDEKSRKVIVKAVRRAINSNTILIVGSAPSFPHGVIDPIEDLSKLAVKYKVGLHVDSCLGGFLVPFMKKAGFNLKPFDFALPGVTSISADTHKYGYAPKGSSVILYRNKEIRKYQYFIAPNWEGGIYACPTIPGSRAGGIIAATWAALMHHGENGYVECTKKIIKTRQYIEEGLRKIKGIKVIGDPEVSVVGFGSDEFDIYKLTTLLSGLGYNLNALQFPASLHLCVTLLHTQPGVADKFLKDVRDCTVQIMKDPKGETTGVGAIYGMAQAIPDRSMVSELASGFIDAFYSTKGSQNGSL